MRLTVLGGAAAWPNPGQGCSSYLIETDSTQVVVDCGPDTLHELRQHCDYSRVDAIVFSHCHADHVLDLVPYRYGLAYGPVRPNRLIPVWAPSDGRVILDRLADALSAGGEAAETFWSTVFDLRTYHPEDRVTVGNLHFTFAETQHYIRCYALRIEDDAGHSLFYSADTGVIEPVVALARGCDVALIEATLESQPSGPRGIRGHLTPAEAGELARESGAERLILTHLWSERSDIAVVAAAAHEFAGEIVVAKPGLAIDV